MGKAALMNDLPPDPIVQGGLAEFAAEFRRREITARATAETYLDRIAALNPKLEAYIHVARLKTGSLFELAATLGGGLGGLAPGVRRPLEAFARELGLAFQLVDDLDDFATTPGEHRTPVTDLRERIYTLPVVYGCARDDDAGGKLRELLADDGRPLSPDAIEAACMLLEETGAFAAARKRASAAIEVAASALAGLPEGPARSLLGELLDALAPPEKIWSPRRQETA